MTTYTEAGCPFKDGGCSDPDHKHFDPNTSSQMQNPPKPDIGHNNRATLLTSTIEQRKEELMKTMTKPDNEWSELDEILESLCWNQEWADKEYDISKAKTATQALLTKKIVLELERLRNAQPFDEPDSLVDVKRQTRGTAPLETLDRYIEARIKELKGSHE